MSRAAPMQAMDGAAARGRVALQRCEACGTAQYPPRELCQICLSPDLAWDVTDELPGVVSAATVLHHSFEADLRARLPLRIGLVRLDRGPDAVCFVPEAAPGTRVWVRAALDAQGRAVLTAETMA